MAALCVLNFERASPVRTSQGSVSPSTSSPAVGASPTGPPSTLHPAIEVPRPTQSWWNTCCSTILCCFPSDKAETGSLQEHQMPLSPTIQPGPLTRSMSAPATTSLTASELLNAHIGNASTQSRPLSGMHATEVRLRSPSETTHARPPCWKSFVTKFCCYSLSDSESTTSVRTVVHMTAGHQSSPTWSWRRCPKLSSLCCCSAEQDQEGQNSEHNPGWWQRCAKLVCCSSSAEQESESSSNDTSWWHACPAFRWYISRKENKELVLIKLQAIEGFVFAMQRRVNSIFEMQRWMITRLPHAHFVGHVQNIIRVEFNQVTRDMRKVREEVDGIYANVFRSEKATKETLQMMEYIKGKFHNIEMLVKNISSDQDTNMASLQELAHQKTLTLKEQIDRVDTFAKACDQNSIERFKEAHEVRERKKRELMAALGKGLRESERACLKCEEATRRMLRDYINGLAGMLEQRLNDIVVRQTQTQLLQEKLALQVPGATEERPRKGDDAAQENAWHSDATSGIPISVNATEKVNASTDIATQIASHGGAAEALAAIRSAETRALSQLAAKEDVVEGSSEENLGGLSGNQSRTSKLKRNNNKLWLDFIMLSERFRANRISSKDGNFDVLEPESREDSNESPTYASIDAIIQASEEKKPRIRSRSPTTDELYAPPTPQKKRTRNKLIEEASDKQENIPLSSHEDDRVLRKDLDGSTEEKKDGDTDEHGQDQETDGEERSKRSERARS